jgi:hypothetical protein
VLVRMARSTKVYGIAFLGLVLVASLSFYFLYLSKEKTLPEGPPQPIAFSHRLHAGTLQLACVYCHTAATRSAVAGVPPVKTCYECHRLVSRERPEIAKVLGYWDAQQPIPWVRVYHLPDHVYFSHKRHVRAEVSCQTCHGEVEVMERVSQVAPLTMGWCVQCHEEENAPLECSTCHQ